MKTIITGISSFVGSNTAKQLIQAQYETYGILRPKSRMKPEQAEKLSGVKAAVLLDFDDVPNPDSRELAAFMDNSSVHGLGQFDCWMHFAWDGVGSIGRSNPEIQRRNVENAQKAYRIARWLGCKLFVFAGSQAEYGRGNAEQPQPVSEYGKAKLQFGLWAKNEAEKADGIPFLHLRLFSVYGPGDHETSLVSSCIQTLLNGEEFKAGPCTQIWNYMYIDDCARAIRAVVESPVTEAYRAVDIAAAEGKPLRDYVETIASLCGGQGKVIFGARENNTEGAANLLPDTQSLRKTGFIEQYTFEDGIYQTILAIEGAKRT